MYRGSAANGNKKKQKKILVKFRKINLFFFHLLFKTAGASSQTFNQGGGGYPGGFGHPGFGGGGFSGSSSNGTFLMLNF